MQKLAIKLPDSFEKALGYDGKLRWVAFYWEPCGDEAVYEDGVCSADCNWYGFLALVEHPKLAPSFYPYNLGSSDYDADHWLLADLVARELYIGPKAEIRGFIRRESDKAFATLAELAGVEISPELHRGILEDVMAKVREIKPPSMEEVERHMREELEAVERMVAELR